MSNLLEENSVMAPQISPKDIPQGGQNSDSEEDEQVAPVILENSSSDDDDNIESEQDENQGYVQLAQDDSEGQQAPDQWVSNLEEEDSDAVNTPVADNNESNSSSSLSSADRSAEPEMKPEEVDLIRQVMSGITLPSSAIPDWAKVVPEEKWKASLVSSITNRTPSPPDGGTKK